MDRIANILYRPTENHVGVIYRNGRFHRLVDPDSLVFTIPWFESISREIGLDMHTARVSLKDVYTREKIAIDLEFKIFYLVDLRKVDAAHRTQVLRFSSENAWEEIIRTQINDISRNSIFISQTFDELSTREGQRFLKRRLSSELAERVQGFGIVLNPRFGVNVVNLQPNEEFRKALMDASAASSLGSAAASRLTPLQDLLRDQDREKALSNLILQIASAITKSGEVPDVILPSADDYSSDGISRPHRQNLNTPNITGFTVVARKPKSIAGD